MDSILDDVHTNPHISKNRIIISAPYKGLRILKSGKILLMESGILGFGIRNTAQGFRNPTNDWNPEPKFH